jgi:hypothetical protein
MGNRLTLEEQIKANKRMINKAIRELDRERAQLERDQKKLEVDIKKLGEFFISRNRCVRERREVYHREGD